MDLGLKGKTALVTASSKGMGKACALGFAAEGARVVMCARTERDLSAAADEVRAQTGGEVLAIPADVTRADQVKALAARARDQFGGIDILVANAGGPPRGVFDELSDEQWYGAFEVSLLSVVRLIREVLPDMRARRWGRIITIQSSSVKQPIAGLDLSNAVRPGTAGLMKTLASDLGPDNILVNTVCPGRILTDRLPRPDPHGPAARRRPPGRPPARGVRAPGRRRRSTGPRRHARGVRQRRGLPRLRARILRHRRRPPRRRRPRPRAGLSVIEERHGFAGALREWQCEVSRVRAASRTLQ